MTKTNGKAPELARGDAERGFIFVPLGGTGEIGMNFNLYGCDGAWMAVDCGIGFSGPGTPETEILLEEVSKLIEPAGDQSAPQSEVDPGVLSASGDICYKPEARAKFAPLIWVARTSLALHTCLGGTP